MVAKLALFLTAFATVAFAAPGGSPSFSSQCNTGSQLCCNSVQDSTSDSFAKTAGLLGLDLSSITGPVGLGCVPLAGSACAAQPVCCEGNQFKGLINVGCSPLSL